MERVAALRRVLFLRTLDEEVLATLAGSGEERRLRKGELLFAEHDRCLGLVVVLTGAVKVYKLDSRGREITLDRETPGESVADLPLFDGGNYPASAEAAEEDTTLLVVGRERFQALMAAHPSIAELALRALGVRMRKLVWMLEAQALHPVRARLAGYLLRTADARTTFRLDHTNEAIGSQIGTVREVVSRTLRSLQDAGTITLSGRHVTLQDSALLQRIANSDNEDALLPKTGPRG